MIHGVEHTAISVPDLRVAIDFYCGVLGFELESESGWPKGVAELDALVGLAESASEVAMLRMGETRIEIFQYESPEPRPQDLEFRVCDHGLTHFCLAVTGIEDEYARLVGAGVVFNAPPVELGASICAYGRDPFGNVFELKQDRSEARA
ncbi:MAG: hypothetical protein GY910_16005 [bacterium]|nr:hypothetical protein [bacterium]